MKKLYRDFSGKKIAGVCGGIGKYLEVDPTIIRIVFFVLAVLYGFGVLAYIIMWAIIPKEPVEVPEIKEETKEGES